MSEKPKPVDAWAVYVDDRKIPIAVYENERLARQSASVKREDSISSFRVIPVTITAKEE